MATEFKAIMTTNTHQQDQKNQPLPELLVMAFAELAFSYGAAIRDPRGNWFGMLADDADKLSEIAKKLRDADIQNRRMVATGDKCKLSMGADS